MAAFIEKTGFSVVSLIIPQARLHNCLKQVLSQWPYKVIQFDCRGTMIREHWFQAFLPTMNPECEYLQLLVCDKDLSAFVQFCIEVNDLHLPGSGAIFSTQCSYFSTNSEFNLLIDRSQTQERSLQDTSAISLKNNLYALYALVQSGRTDNAIKAAMQAGSHGPIVYFVEGRGTRDRVSWLKITKKPYEEVVMVLVEDIDRERVKEALVSAGRINTLGGGIVFEISIEHGLVNLPTSISNKSRLASNQQITAAVDQLMGSTDWRDTRSIATLLDKNQRSKEQADTQKSSSLCALIPRKHADEFLDYILSIGIPGANVIYTKLFSGDDDQNAQHLNFHHELVQIRMVLPTEQCAHFRSQLQQFVTLQGYRNVTIYALTVKGVARYQLKPRERSKGAVYRGSSSIAD